jgi:MFS family permease
VARQDAAVGGSATSAALPTRWLLLTILTTSYGAGAFGMLGLSPLSPSLLDGFGLTRFQLAFIVPAIYVGGLFFSLPGGRLADRIYAVWPVSAPAMAGALAFATGVGAYGWVGVFFVISAEAGGPRQAGLLSGVAYASIVVGLLVGPPVFGLLLEGADSYATAWTAFAALSALVTITMLTAGPMINRAGGSSLPRR